jgi:hypothetical protein
MAIPSKDDKTLATKILRRLLLDSNYSRFSNFVMKFSENSQKMPQKSKKHTNINIPTHTDI